MESEGSNEFIDDKKKMRSSSSLALPHSKIDLLRQPSEHLFNNKALNSPKEIDMSALDDWNTVLKKIDEGRLKVLWYHGLRDFYWNEYASVSFLICLIFKSCTNI